MKWALWTCLAAFAVAGCKAPAPSLSSVWGRPTVPPPKPGEVIAPQMADSYYPGAPPAPASAASRLAPPDGWSGAPLTRSTTTTARAPTNSAPATTGDRLTPPPRTPSKTLRSASPEESPPATTRAAVSQPRGANEPALLSPDPAARSIAQSSTAAVRQASFTETIQPAGGSSSRGSRSRYAYDPGYAWLQGRLEFSPATKRWKLRYIPLDGATDEHGGSVMLDDSPQLAQFRHGDFVRMEGRLGERGVDTTVFAPSYRVERIERAE
jgi:hypothetical protein